MPDIIARTTASLSAAERAAIDHEIACYPHRQSVCIEALKIVQQARGWVSDEAVAAIADYLDMGSAEVDGVATFYNLIFRRPVGRQVIFLCDSVSCWLLGSATIKEHISARLGIDYGETTGDGQYTLLPISCLGDCDHAPTLMIDQQQYRDVDLLLLDELFGSGVQS